MQSSSQIITTNISTPVFLQAGCRSCRPTNSVKALKGKNHITWTCLPQTHLGVFQLWFWPLMASGYLTGVLPCLSSALWCQYPSTSSVMMPLVSVNVEQFFSKTWQWTDTIKPRSDVEWTWWINLCHCSYLEKDSFDLVILAGSKNTVTNSVWVWYFHDWHLNTVVLHTKQHIVFSCCSGLIYVCVFLQIFCHADSKCFRLRFVQKGAKLCKQ